MRDTADLSNLPEFLNRLGRTDAASAQFAQQVLDAGGIVRVFWGPEQMDVWELQVQRGDMIVRFGIERGYSDGVRIAPAGAPVRWDSLRPLHLAVIAWARANGIPLQWTDPDGADIDLVVHGLAALDWVGDGHDAEVEGVQQAWRGYHEQLGRLRSSARGNPSESDVRAAKASALAAMDQVASARPADGAQYWRRSLSAGDRYFKLVDGRDFILESDRWVPYDRYKSGPSWWRLTGEIGADIIDPADLPPDAPR